MERICAWCGARLGSSTELASDGDITHGICSPCALELTNDRRRTVHEILDTIAEPILIVDQRGLVVDCNETAAARLNKKIDAIRNRPGGEVLECEYSQLPGGCGNTEHCSACAIRNTVMQTLATGGSCTRVPAYNYVRAGADRRMTRIMISTERLGQLILLRIDDPPHAAGSCATSPAS